MDNIQKGTVVAVIAIVGVVSLECSRYSGMSQDWSEESVTREDVKNGQTR